MKKMLEELALKVLKNAEQITKLMIDINDLKARLYQLEKQKADHEWGHEL